MKNFAQLIKNKEHVIWDWNGTILDDISLVIEVINEILDDHSLEKITADRYRDIFEFPVINYYQKLGFNTEKENFEKLSYRFVDTYMQRLSQCQPYTHSPLLLKSVIQSNKRQSILSATDQENLDRVVEHYGLRHYFDHVCGIGDKFASSKLQQGKLLIEKLPISKDKIVLVGDTEHDLEVGLALGIEVILLAHGHQSRTRLEKAHDQVIMIQELIENF